MGLSINQFFLANFIFMVGKNLFFSLILAFILGFSFLQEIDFSIVLIAGFVYLNFCYLVGFSISLFLKQVVKSIFLYCAIFCFMNVFLLNIYELRKFGD